MAAEEATTWGEVCKQVGFGENLYRTCRDKDPSFKGFAGGVFDDVPGDDYDDFNTQLADSALAIPAPPAADWQAPDEGFMSTLFGELTPEKIAMYGGVAAAIWWFFLRSKNEAAAAPVSQNGVTTEKAA